MLYNQDMSRPSTSSSPSVAAVLPVAFFLAVPGCAGLFWVTMETLPTLWPRWLFFFFLTLTATGMALPLVALLNRRFAGHPPATHGVLLRQALWVGIYAPVAAWLQMGQVLTPGVLLLLALGFGTIEYLLRLRERSRWRMPSGG
ncbi:MAG: hypothetical protein Fur0018_26200 [Anaerolineales bacterium]